MELNMKYLVGAVVVLGLLVGVMVALPGDTDVVRIPVGGSAGPDHYNQQRFMDGTVDGGSILNASSTLYTALTLTASQVCDNSFIHVNSTSTSATVQDASSNVTFPATSTMFSQCLSYEGATKQLYFRNNSPTAATTTELVAGTGCELRLPEETGADNDIDGLNEARLTFTRATDWYADGGTVDCVVLVEETVVD